MTWKNSYDYDAPPRPNDKGPILNRSEWEELIYLLSLYNDLNITQIDHEESDRLSELMEKLGAS